jgi:hypothetical protein
MSFCLASSRRRS